LAAFKEFLPRLDGCQLAAFRQHIFCLERSALYVGDVSDFYIDEFGSSQKLVGECAFYCLVDSFSRGFHDSICEGLVGFLDFNFTENFKSRLIDS